MSRMLLSLLFAGVVSAKEGNSVRAQTRSAEVNVEVPEVGAKQEVEGVVGGSKMARSQSHASLPFLSIPSEVVKQLGNDPVALTSSFLMAVYILGHAMMKIANGKPGLPGMLKSKAEQKGAPSSPTEQRRRPNTRKPAKSSIAVGINQELTKLQTPDEVLDFAIENLDSTDIVNVVTAIHRSAKLSIIKRHKGLCDDPRLAQLLERLLHFFEEEMQVHILTRAVGNTSWALAKLQWKDDGEPSILEALHHNFTEYAEHFKPEELMNTVWAFAEMSRDTRESGERALLVARAAARCSSRFESFTLQQVVYFSWALARLSNVAAIRTDPEVHAGLAVFKSLIIERVEPGMDSLTTKNLAMVSWAAAHLQKVKSGSDIAPLLQSVAAHAEKRGLRAFYPGELASIIWALSKSQVRNKEFFQKFRDHALKEKFAGFSSQDLANVVCAFINAEVEDDVFYTMLGQQVQKQGAKFNKLEKTMVNWAFALVPHIAPPKIGS